MCEEQAWTWRKAHLTVPGSVCKCYSLVVAVAVYEMVLFPCWLLWSVTCREVLSSSSPTVACPSLYSTGVSWILEASVFFSRCCRFLNIWAASSMPATVCGVAGRWGCGIHLTRSLTNSHLLILSFFSFFLENIPRETLMHFAVRLGLLRLTWFLLQQPGGRGALSIHNNEGATPVSLALERGYQKLYQLLTE